MKKYLIIIPTYNERKNIGDLIEIILKNRESPDILVVDDNSSDGTGIILDELAERDFRVKVLHRCSKQGLGTAYLCGFKYALRQGYEFVITMDADFSHNPEYLFKFFEKFNQGYDLIVGSRYIKGGGLKNWPAYRLFLSKAANFYVQFVTGIPIKDSTGGFNGYKKQLLESLDLNGIRSNGYAFQIEVKYNIWKKLKDKKFKIIEIPIIFCDRTKDKSKLGKGIIKEALFLVWKLRLGTKENKD